MNVKSTIVVELNKGDIELLNILYTRSAIKIMAYELSLIEINQLIEKLMIS